MIIYNTFIYYNRPDKIFKFVFFYYRNDWNFYNYSK